MVGKQTNFHSSEIVPRKMMKTGRMGRGVNTIVWWVDDKDECLLVPRVSSDHINDS